MSSSRAFRYVAERALLLLASVVFSLAIAEGAARLFTHPRNVGPTFSTYDPVYGKRNKPNTSAVRITPEFTFRWTTNSLGFRGPEPDGFPSGGVLFLGDSFTFGYGVDDGEEFPALVRESLARDPETRDIPVVNTGIGDYGNGGWLRFLEREGERFAPRLVVFQFTANDFGNNHREKLYALDAGGSLVPGPGRPPNPYKKVQEFFEAVPGLSSTYLFGLARQIPYLRVARRRAAREEGGAAETGSRRTARDELTYRIFEEVARHCTANGRPAIVLLAGIDGERAERLTAIAREAGFPVVRVPTNRERPDLYNVMDGHWKPGGHELAAQAIVDTIRARGLL